jgi:hypothetical protein
VESGERMVEEATVSATDRWVGHQLLMAHQGDGVGLVGWAAQGLARGDTLLYAADELHPDTAALAATLGSYGLDAGAAVDDGRLTVVDPTRFYDLTGYEQLVDQGLREGPGGVRSYGGCEVAAEVLDPPGFVAFEGLLDRLWSTRGASALCCYPHTGAEALHEAIRRHRSGWGQRLLHLHHRDGAVWGVHGEVDIGNDELFATLLAAAADRAAAHHAAHHAAHDDADRAAGRAGGAAPGADTGPGGGPALVLDCAGLRFSGVAAWRSALAGTAAFRSDGGRVVLTGLRPHIGRMLQLTGFATAFDLRGPAGGGSAP